MLAEHLELQRRIRDGETFETAAAAVSCSTKSVQRLLATTGGVKPRVNPTSALRLSLAEREEISRGVLSGESCRSIARQLADPPRPSPGMRKVTAAGLAAARDKETNALAARPGARRTARRCEAPTPGRRRCVAGVIPSDGAPSLGDHHAPARGGTAGPRAERLGNTSRRDPLRQESARKTPQPRYVTTRPQRLFVPQIP
jgi:hypothetical protein